MTQFASNFLGTTPFSDTTATIALAANTAITYTVPGDNSMSYRAEFSWPYDSNVYVGYNVAATTAVAGTVTSTANVELRPDARYVRGGDVLSFKSVGVVTAAGLRLLKLP